MWKKLYSNSGLILLAVLAAGIWFSNVRSFFSAGNAPEYAAIDAVLAASRFPSPTPMPLTIEEVLSATARCKDGAYSWSHSKREACSCHGGVAQWFSQQKGLNDANK